MFLRGIFQGDAIKLSHFCTHHPTWDRLRDWDVAATWDVSATWGRWLDIEPWCRTLLGAGGWDGMGLLLSGLHHAAPCMCCADASASAAAQAQGMPNIFLMATQFAEAKM